MSQFSPTATLSDYISHWQPQPIRVDDDMDPERSRHLAATLDLADAPGAGDLLPPLWHWLYFLDWPATSKLGDDGHPEDGPFLPPIPLRRRMFAGGRLTQLRPLTLGTPATRVASVRDITVKHGRSGEMLFVTVHNEYSQDDQPHLIEEQDLVYRSGGGAPGSAMHEHVPFTAPPAAWTARPQPTATLLFRFSALTANAHRIHYDETYTTATEGFPALVVHGPLLALYMAELLRANTSSQTLRTLEFRINKPVFLGDRIGIHGHPRGRTAELSVVSGAGQIHSTAKAELW